MAYPGSTWVIKNLNTSSLNDKQVTLISEAGERVIVQLTPSRLLNIKKANLQNIEGRSFLQMEDAQRNRQHCKHMGSHNDDFQKYLSSPVATFSFAHMKPQ